MNIDEIEKLISSLKPIQNIELSDIPMLDLYMDQVIQLFENKFSETLRNTKEKVLTKTMINNYSKDKIFMSTKNKKYSPEHIILLSLIYQMKGSLSISDIKTALNPIVKSIEDNDVYSAEHFYKLYSEIFKQDTTTYIDTINTRITELTNLNSERVENFTDSENNLLIIMSLITMSNLYRKTAEKIIDQFMINNEK
jgi:hypothetical protein